MIICLRSVFLRCIAMLPHCTPSFSYSGQHWPEEPDIDFHHGIRHRVINQHRCQLRPEPKGMIATLAACFQLLEQQSLDTCTE